MPTLEQEESPFTQDAEDVAAACPDLLTIMMTKEIEIHKHGIKSINRRDSLKLYYLGGRGGFHPLMFFFHHPETAQATKLKLSDFKDTCLRHILQVVPSCYILRCYHGDKITKRTLQNLTQ